MKRALTAFLLLATAVAVSGCFIDMTSVTKINDDGSGFRITTYTADGASEKEELIKNYMLPRGGDWKLEDYTKDNPPRHIYEVKRAFKDINSLAPDYTRRGADTSNVSGNRYLLDIRRGILYTAYFYKESFYDCMDEAKMRAFCDKWYAETLDIISSDVSKAFPKSVKKEDVASFIEGKFRPYLDFFMREMAANGRKSLDEGKDGIFQQKMSEFEDLYGREEFAGYMADFIVSKDQGQDRKKAYEKLLALHESIDAKLSALGDSYSENNYGDVFGVYGWPIFMGYTFNVSVTLPGKIVESNAKKVKQGTASWEFKSDDFQVREYQLVAVSRKFNPAGAVVMAVLSALLAYMFYRRSPAKK